MEPSRRLAVIMFTDIAGFTALMQKDEYRVIQRIEHHRTVLSSLHRKFDGKIVQYFGDGTLSLFDNARDAVNCAIGIQQSLQSRELLPLRIGIHMGEVMLKDDWVIGDAVNIASRIESFAIEGGVFISDAVKDQVANKGLSFISLGMFKLKNVIRPIEIYAVVAKGIQVPGPLHLKGKGERIGHTRNLPISHPSTNTYHSAGRPTTQYTKSGRLNIAYQIYGDGPVDLVYIPGWVSNIDLMWDCPELVHFLNELGKIARIILFDKRGTGLSDRVVELSTLEERMDDIRAVMDAAGSQKAILFGHSEGGAVSALFAATYPNRTISLIAFGIFAKRRYSPEYPWAPTDEERQVVYDMIETSWGSGEMNLESLAPSKANDKAFMRWLANYFRSGASPSAAMVLTKMNTEVDIINILDSIRVPTLLMQRQNDIDVKIEEGRFIASRIKDARLVEFEGDDHLFWAGDTEEVLQEMKAFITNVQPLTNYEERLFTILRAKVISGKETLPNLEQMIEQYIMQYRGSIVFYDQGSFIARFEGPNKAVHCSLDLANALSARQVELAIGIYIKESALDEVHFVNSEIDDLVISILEDSQPGEILITEVVKHLLSGSGLSIQTHPTKHETLLNESMALYKVKNHFPSGNSSREQLQRQHLRNDSFLENVLQCIDNHLSDDTFTVEVLCRDIGISERQLQRKIKAISNKSPNQLITSVRLHRAKELILNGNNHISEVAFQTGFSNPSYFSKRFKNEFGMSPTDLARNTI